MQPREPGAPLTTAAFPERDCRALCAGFHCLTEAQTLSSPGLLRGVQASKICRVSCISVGWYRGAGCVASAAGLCVSPCL